MTRTRPSTPEHSVETMISSVAEYAECFAEGRSHENKLRLNVEIVCAAGSGVGSDVTSGSSSGPFGEVVLEFGLDGKGGESRSFQQCRLG